MKICMVVVTSSIWEMKQSMPTFQNLIVIIELEQSSRMQFWKDQSQKHKNVTPG